MKVKHINLGGKLPESMTRLGYSPTVDLHLDIGEDYIVYGVMMWRSTIHYLIVPDDLLVPYWLPADLFDTVESRLPYDWYIRYFRDGDPSGLKFMIGYKEMVLEDKHYTNLIERDKGAIRIFLDRKKEIDEMS